MSYRNELHGLDSNGERDDEMNDDAGNQMNDDQTEEYLHGLDSDEERDDGMDALEQSGRIAAHKMKEWDGDEMSYLPKPVHPPGQEISRWADAAMFHSEPMPKGAGSTGPQVTLLNATPDPLGSLAALCSMYSGRVVRSLSEVTDEQRQFHYTDVTKSKLQGPLEVVQFHFLIEGVTRAFTHQMVRERQAFFAQESMRFAVVDNELWTERAALPISIPSNPQTTEDALTRDAWDDALINAQNAYQILIERGVPAEDARGIMPHAMTTRLHWVVDLRGLLYVAGLRLCTQAQFEWRQVMAQVVKALRSYVGQSYIRKTADSWPVTGADSWQFELIADSLKPICYQEGKCGFKAKMDRPCSIRERVDANEAAGRDSSRWSEPLISHTGNAEAIRPEEWAADPTAARRSQ
jgi:flavin-dependent thymidylate synthase